MNQVQQSIVEQFAKSFSLGVEHICVAAKLYVEALDKHGLTREDFSSKIPGIPPGAWAGLEAVGRGIIDKRLLWGGGRASSHLRKLPLSEQRNALDNGVKILTSGGDALVVMPEVMTKEQCEIVFAPDHIRTIGEQRAYIEQASRVEPLPLESIAADCPYEVRGHKLIINRPMVLTVADVKRLMGQMR